MAASTLSLGMLTARAFWMMRRSSGLAFGSGPPARTAMVISLLSRANCFDIRSQRANIACFLTSKIRPMVLFRERGPRGGAQSSSKPGRARRAPWAGGPRYPGAPHGTPYQLRHPRRHRPPALHPLLRGGARPAPHPDAAGGHLLRDGAHLARPLPA